MPNQTANVTDSQSTNRTKADTRGVWLLTGYGAAFLGLLGVLAYYFSNYITH